MPSGPCCWPGEPAGSHSRGWPGPAGGGGPVFYPSGRTQQYSPQHAGTASSAPEPASGREPASDTTDRVLPANPADGDRANQPDRRGRATGHRQPAWECPGSHSPGQFPAWETRCLHPAHGGNRGGCAEFAKHTALSQTAGQPRGTVLADLLAQILPPRHFQLQYTFKGNRGRGSPAQGRMVPVDAKFPLENFQRLSQAPDAARRALRREFLRDVKSMSMRSPTNTSGPMKTLSRLP
ncbi:MAG: DNA recombination protein RmuC [Verrucomicrobia bacterium]|nr:DNA recombination protein RmuC [Verrucomicrobiota bacterium]